MLDQPLTIAAYQGAHEVALAAGGALDTLGRMDTVAREASGRGARLLIFPELYLTGYDIGAERLQAAAEPQDGPAAARAAEIATRHSIAIVYGYPELDATGAVYNAALMIGPNGRPLANHRKAHLFGEVDHSTYAAGDGVPIVADLDGVNVGLAICYDVEFPEFVRGLALRGADLVVVPTALMHPYSFVAHALVATRAYENACFLAYVNRCGRERQFDYVGASCVAGPNGEALARAGGHDNELIVATLDPELLARWRESNRYFDDRRPAIYRALTE